MSKCIDAEKLIQRIQASPLFRNFGEDGEFLRKFVIDLIEQQPTVDVSEQIHNLEQSRDYWKAKAEKAQRNLRMVKKVRGEG